MRIKKGLPPLSKGRKADGVMPGSATTGGSATASASTASVQIGLNGESRSHGAFHEVHVDRLDLVKEVLVDDVRDIVHLEHLVVVFWLVQSHAQRGPGSTTLGEKNANPGDFLLVLQEILDHGVCLVCDLKHAFLLWGSLPLPAGFILQ